MLRVDKSIVGDWKEKKKKKQKIGNGVENRKTILKYSIGGDFLGAVVQLQ